MKKQVTGIAGNNSPREDGVGTGQQAWSDKISSWLYKKDQANEQIYW